jgi:ADP-heptose:LPS heptosyltransferase
MKPGVRRLLRTARTAFFTVLTSPLTLALRLQRQGLSRRPYSGRILLVRLDAIGDYVLFRNFIESCKKSRRFRGLKLDLLGNVRWRGLAQALDARFVDRCYWIDPRSPFQRKLIQFRLNASRYALIIQPTYSRRQDHDELARALHAETKVAPRGDRCNMEETDRDLSSSAYTELIETDSSPGRFEFQRNKDFFERLLKSPIRLEMPVINAALLGRRQTPLPEAYACFHMDASESEKCWKTENFAEVARFFTIEKGLAVVLLGGKDESTTRFEDMVGRRELVFDLRGRTSLLEAARIVAESTAFVGNDSSLLHIAAATGVKNIVAVCYGKSFGRFAPYPPHRDVSHVFVFPPRIESRRSNPEHLREQYADGTFEDVDLIRPEIVIKDLRSLLTSARRRPAASRVFAR